MVRTGTQRKSAATTELNPSGANLEQQNMSR